MNSEKRDDNKWAPWWLYVAVIAGGSFVKSLLVPDLPVLLNGLLTLTLGGFLFLVITVAYRSMKSAGQQRH
ncbi:MULTISPECIES: hypothetical protein [unclassified Micromonospora]|uniref:hypothetical protein n=1 Tax=unclassified Micromonospora TaxID=2617518 RepID=UPI0022B6AF6D|nr:MULTISPECIES: hypothetical protein [unclassified Micromonospora]MCZ7421951.1 hypothetical protein [Verrucosispora sp. WMMA2121]WBB93314.1 hypothetical protein O7597_10220 [Verrucosispora sp. WMMC514]